MKLENQSVGIFGTGGMALEAGDIVISLGGKPIYIAEEEPKISSSDFAIDFILERDIGNHVLSHFCIGIGDWQIRRKIFDKFHSRLRFINIIHPTATFGHLQYEKLKHTQGLIIAAGARLTNNIELGKCCIINQNATISHHCKLGDFTHIACGANISGHVEVGDNSWVGAGATINNGSEGNPIKVGFNTTIGSGAVVLENCESNSTYVGNPARKIK